MLGIKGQVVKFWRNTLAKATRKVNDRLRALAKQLGAASPYMEQQYARLDKVIPPENLRFNKDGVLQIIGPKSLGESGVSPEQIQEVIDHIPTFSELKKKNERDYEEAKEGGYTGSFKRFMNDIYDMFQNLPMIYEKAGEIIADGTNDFYMTETGIFDQAIHGVEKTGTRQDLPAALSSAEILLSY